MTKIPYKFRAWNKMSEEWYDENQFIIYCGELYKDFRKLEDGSPETDFALMQFTGLIDKDKVEVFEGDIVRDMFGEMFTVTYDNGFVGYILNEVGSDICIEILSQWHCDSRDMYGIKVVGNIYENSDMLMKNNVAK